MIPQGFAGWFGSKGVPSIDLLRYKLAFVVIGEQMVEI